MDVYRTYITRVTMVYKPTYNWGAQPCNDLTATSLEY